MAVLDLSKHLGKVRNRVSFVGVELEGGWKTPLPPLLRRLVGDGSVFRGQKLLEMPEASQHGEAPSPPLQPAGVAKWVQTCYPTWKDETCGMHVHMSFQSAKHYELLTNEDYQDTILDYLKRWAVHEEQVNPGIFPPTHHIWSRLAGENRFAQKKFWPEKQIVQSKKNYAAGDEGHRYTALNFCYSLHKTLECRVLPMMVDSAQAVRAVQACIDITNAALVVLAKKSEAVYEEVIMLPENLYEEFDQEVI